MSATLQFWPAMSYAFDATGRQMILQPATVAKERPPAGAIFVSHAADDARVALTIALGLENAGYSTWCFEVDSVPGVSYLVQIGEAIERASAVVLVISSLALHSRQVTIEVVRAHESDKPLLPVLIDVTHEQFQHASARSPARQHSVARLVEIISNREALVVAGLPRSTERKLYGKFGLPLDI